MVLPVTRSFMPWMKLRTWAYARTASTTTSAAATIATTVRNPPPRPLLTGRAPPTLCLESTHIARERSRGRADARHRIAVIELFGRSIWFILTEEFSGGVVREELAHGLTKRGTAGVSRRAHGPVRTPRRVREAARGAAGHPGSAPRRRRGLAGDRLPRGPGGPGQPAVQLGPGETGVPPDPAPAAGHRPCQSPRPD